MRIEDIKGVSRRNNAAEIKGFPEDQHVVYFHRDPETQDVVYVGEGKTCRPYTLNRSEEHFLWLMEQLDKGYTMEDIVDVRSTGYTKQEAKAVEKHNIKRCLIEGCKLFNVNHNQYKSREGSNGTSNRLSSDEEGPAWTTTSWSESSHQI